MVAACSLGRADYDVVGTARRFSFIRRSVRPICAVNYHSLLDSCFGYQQFVFNCSLSTSRAVAVQHVVSIILACTSAPCLWFAKRSPFLGWGFRFELSAREKFISIRALGHDCLAMQEVLNRCPAVPSSDVLGLM